MKTINKFISTVLDCRYCKEIISFDETIHCFQNFKLKASLTQMFWK